MDRLSFMDEVRKSYQMAADTVHGVFMPAGAACMEAWSVEPSLALYGADGFHPSTTGTLLAAMVIYERITGKDARNLPAMTIATNTTMKLDEATVRMLESSAHAANQKYP
jgi:hypothetical protein